MPHQYLNIRGSSNNKISIEPTEIRADAGLNYPRLIVPARFDLNPLQESQTGIKQYIIQNVECALQLKENRVKISESISGSSPYSVTRAGLWVTFSLEFPLDAIRISKSEELRRGDLELTLQFAVNVVLCQNDYLNSIERVNVSIDINIPQSHWINKILPQLEFGEYFLVEIPKGKEKISEVWEYIEKTESCFKSWDTKGTFANCREIGDFLDKELKKRIGKQPIIKKWKRAIERFKYLASLGLHIEDIQKEEPEGTIKIGKSDSEFLLIQSKALVKYAEELLQENSRAHIK